MTEYMAKSDPWERTLELLEEVIQQPSYDTWIKPLEIVNIFGNKFVVACEDPMAVKTLKTRYNSTLTGAIRQAYGRDYEVVVVQKNQPLPPEALPQSSSLRGGLLNPKYTFDTFVVGASNRFAHAASLAVAELPSEAYNPLFLYGGVGLGKTHLMHAIGHFVLNENPDAKILYITSENFTNELIDAISKKTNHEFREKLRNVDILMVDDIQFIAGKTATQEEFFHTFNQLHGSGKQIIISSDRPPKDIPTLEERLRSRFEWGLIADIQKPDYETRSAILRKKAEQDHIDVPDEVIRFIAENVESNIRELEGYLTRVTATAMLGQKPITRELAEETLQSVMGPREQKRMTPELIMDVVGQKYGVDKSALVSQRRNREVAMPRQICMFFAREMTSLSTTRIGDAFGGRDHTTVMHACDKVQTAIEKNPQFAKQMQDLRDEIHGR